MQCFVIGRLNASSFVAETWPSQLGIAHGNVMEQWLFSIFSIVSGMIGLGYGSYPPVTWGEALLWVFAMLVSPLLSPPPPPLPPPPSPPPLLTL